MAPEQANNTNGNAESEERFSHEVLQRFTGGGSPLSFLPQIVELYDLSNVPAWYQVVVDQIKLLSIDLQSILKPLIDEV